jgi:multiple sugar transport system substrate-binding protein
MKTKNKDQHSGGEVRESVKALTRRSVLRGSLGLVAAGSLARPHIANAAATTAEVWWTQGFVQEEDVAFRKLIADYEKASGNKIEENIFPFAPLRQKMVAAMATGVVPDIMEYADFSFLPLNAWNDKLIDVSDIVEPMKSLYIETALPAAYSYNNVLKKRSYYAVSMKCSAVPFNIWRSLIEKAGYKVGDIPNTWDAFLDFFMSVQDKLRAQGMRNIYAYGYQLTANGVDPGGLFQGFLMAYGGRGLVTPDGKLHTEDPHIREAAIKAIAKLTTAYKKGYVPPGCVNWNDADDNNAFHSKLVVMDFDGFSTEVALYNKKAEYDDILTRGFPLGDDGKELPSPMAVFGALIPKGAKNVTVARDFLKYAVQPNVLNEYLKGGLGRWVIPMPEIAKADPFWFHEDPHRTAFAEETLTHPTVPLFQAFNPAMAQIDSEHVFSVAMLDVMTNGMTPEQAVDKAFKRAEAIFAKYPIAQA